MHEPYTNTLPDESLAADMLPLVLAASGLIAVGGCGLLLIWDRSFQIMAYSIPFVLIVGTVLAERQRSIGEIRQSGAIISYTFGLAPLLSIPWFGIADNPLIYMAPIGLGLAALLVSADAAVLLARLYALLLIGCVLLFVSPLLSAVLPVLAALLLVVGTTVLSWMGAYSVRGTIDWALETGQKAERRELLLRETQSELERSLRERDRLNERLHQLNYDLEHAKLAAEAAYRSKASFMATMSHELRTPLNLVIGFSTAIIEHPEMYAGEPLSDLYRNDIAEIQQSGRHLLELINDILDLAKVEAGKLELQTTTLNIHPLLMDSLKAAGALIKDRSISIRPEFPLVLPPVRADEMRIRQILLNLISNACKFTQKGEVVLGAAADGQMLEIWVRDTGIGIDKKDQMRIFGEFEQVESHDIKQQGGTGLGLAICRWLVELHGGRMRLESTLGEGSTFYFTLPCIEIQTQPMLPDVSETIVDTLA